jgi:type 1 glutamine amidotransferase
MHPEYGTAKIRVHSDRHPIVAGIGDFEVQDERYTYLRMAEDVVPLLGHLHEGVEYPLLWTRDHHGARVVYDALGHDVQSYRSPEHRTILRRTARWLLGDM